MSSFTQVTLIRTFPSPLEEESNHKNLQCSHRYHHQPLNDTKVEDPSLRTTHGTEVAVFTRPEVLLVPRDGRQLCRQLEDRLFESRCLFGTSASLSRGKLGAFLVFDLEINDNMSAMRRNATQRTKAVNELIAERLEIRFMRGIGYDNIQEIGG